MTLGFIPIEHYKTKFYQKENQSKRFKELTEEQLATLAKRVYRKQEIIEDSISPFHRSPLLERYQRVLLYLTNPNIHLISKHSMKEWLI